MDKQRLVCVSVIGCNWGGQKGGARYFLLIPFTHCVLLEQPGGLRMSLGWK